MNSRPNQPITLTVSFTNDHLSSNIRAKPATVTFTVPIPDSVLQVGSNTFTVVCQFFADRPSDIANEHYVSSSAASLLTSASETQGSSCLSPGLPSITFPPKVETELFVKQESPSDLESLRVAANIDTQEPSCKRFCFRSSNVQDHASIAAQCKYKALSETALHVDTQQPPPNVYAIPPANFSGCMFCGQRHYTAECRQVLSISDRFKIIAKQGRCFKCLYVHHPSKCHRKRRCCVCKSTHHHPALCFKSSFLEIDVKEDIEVFHRNMIQLSEACFFGKH